MINPQIINDLADKLSEVLPKVDNTLGADIRKNIFEVLKSSFKRMELVSSEEFEVQKRLLANLEKKLSLLEDKVIELEKERDNCQVSPRCSIFSKAILRNTSGDFLNKSG